ncbi:MAG: NUDIX domain-containing protein, partial [Ginsengibacter sp.]
MVPTPNKNTKTLKGLQSEVHSLNKIALSVDCVVFGFDENKLKVLLIKSDLKKFNSQWSLLGDLVRPEEDLEGAAYRILEQRTGLSDVYLEQVHTFGKVDRHPAGRVVTVAYCTLINTQNYQLEILDNELHWHDVEFIKELAFDHSSIFDNSYTWLQKRIQEHPLGFNLLP